MFSKNEHTQVLLLDRSAPFMDDIVVSKDRLTKLLKGLNPSKALGPDELHFCLNADISIRNRDISIA